MSAIGFNHEIDSLHESLDEFAAPFGGASAQKNTLADRIDPEVSEQLRRFVRGE